MYSRFWIIRYNLETVEFKSGEERNVHYKLYDQHYTQTYIKFLNTAQ